VLTIFVRANGTVARVSFEIRDPHLVCLSIPSAKRVQLDGQAFQRRTLGFVRETKFGEVLPAWNGLEVAIQGR
jgi:hypothetical protein